MEIVGKIFCRRSIGKTLAFMEIQTTGKETKSSTASDTANIASVAFRKDQFLEPIEEGWDSFPSKRSSLPYGALVRCQIQPTTRYDASGPPFEVLRWKILENPKQTAIEASSVDGTSGLSCSKYLQARGMSYFEQHPTRIHCERKKTPPKTSNHSDFSQAKSQRAKLFAKFIADNILQNDGSDRVLDVAGGKGLLSFEISLHSEVPCVVIDPMIRKVPKFKQLRRNQCPIPEYQAHEFRANDDRSCSAVEQCTCIVGLHPDEPTEDILDLALAYNRSVAVIPCCVFPSFFPMRRLAAGGMVHTYEEFVTYLLEKDCRLKLSSLPFMGKNQVIYLKMEIE